MTDYQRVCAEIANERPHVCTGCGGTQFLSHSHLIPKSYRKDLYVNKENITLHCMSVGKTGCHEKFEGREAPLLNDFAKNMEIIRRLDETYYFKKLFKLHNYWFEIASSIDYNTKKARLALKPFLLAIRDFPNYDELIEKHWKSFDPEKNLYHL